MRAIKGTRRVTRSGKHLLLAVVALAGLGGVMLAGDALAAGRADIEAMITELLEVSGARRVANQVAMNAGNEAIKRYKDLPPAVAAKLLSALAAAYNVDALLASMIDDVRKNSSEDRLNEALQLMRSPLATKMSDLQVKAQSPEAAADLAAFASTLTSQPVDPARSDLIARLDSACGTSDFLVDVSIASLHGLMRAVNAAEPTDRQMSPTELEQLRQAYKAQIQPVIKDQTRTNALFTYRDEPDDELRQYVALWETPDGQWVSRTLNGAILHALSEASDHFARQLLKDLAQMRAQAAAATTTATTPVVSPSAAAEEASPEEQQEGPYWGRPVGHWVDSLTAKDLAVRLTAIEALEAGGARFDSGVRVAVPALLPLLCDGNVKVRRATAHALAALAPDAGLENAIRPLIAGLKDHDSQVRESCARALGRFGSPAAGAIDALTRMVLHDPVCASAAAQALGAMGRVAADAVPVLARAVAQGGRRPNRWAVRALGELGPEAKQATGTLERLREISDLDSVTREEVNAALFRIGP